MTLPTGGQISYKFAGFPDPTHGVAETSLPISSRTTPDSSTPWTYSYYVIPNTCQTNPVGYNGNPLLNCQLQTTVTKPSGDHSVYTFLLNGGAWPIEAQYYDASSNLLTTITQAFNTSTVCSNSTWYPCGPDEAVYVTKASETTTLPVPGSTNVSQTNKFTWDSESQVGSSGVTLYGEMLTKSEWNFGSSVSNPADRTTTYTYLNGSTYIGANILDRVASATVTNNSGGTVAKTLNCYDYAGGCGGSAFGNAGTVTNHDTNYGTGYTVRGDLTQVQKLTSGSNYLTTSQTYDTTGQVLTSTDSAGNITTYSYADNFFNDGSSPANPSNPPSSYSPSTATNAYLTKITHPAANGVQLTEKIGYYWGTGQKALSTDPNSQTTYFHYSDSLSRPTSTELPNSGWNYSAYTGETQIDTGIGITSTTLSASCTGTSGGCRHDQVLLDGLGRTSSQILESDPEGPDTVTTTYDSDGRVSTVTNPHRSTSSPTDGTETYGYDGLDRKATVTHADSAVAYTYYGAFVGSHGGLSAQKCSGVGYPILNIDEAKNLRQTWTDGFGRLVEVDEPSAGGSLSSGIGTCYGYDLNNNLTAVNQGSGAVTRSFVYDDLSRLTQAANPESGTIYYYYTTTTSGTTPCSGDPSEVCLRVAPLENQPKGSNSTITTTYSYDALNRLLSKTYSDGTPGAYFAYDDPSFSGWTAKNPYGRLSSVGTYNGSYWLTGTWFSYDPVGNIISIEQLLPGMGEIISYGLNLDGSISSITYPSSRQVNYLTSNAQRTTMAYDSSNTYAQGPSSACPFNQSNGKGWACYAPPGELDALQNGAKLVTTSFYNNRLQPCRFAVNTGTTAPSSCTDASHFGDKFDIQYSFDLSTLGSQLCSLTYGSYTNNGNVASITNNISGMSGRSQEFCYDALNRITSAQTTSIYSTNSQTCWAEAYGIDAFGNLTSITPITSNSNGSYVGCSQESGFGTTITSGTNQDTASCYDAAGNKAGANPGSCSPLPTTYTYDGENRLISYAPAGESYSYDVDGKRVEKNASSGGTLYWYDRDGDVLAETTTSGSDVNEYVFFGGKRIARVNSSGSVFYYFADQLGTSRVNVQDGSTPTLCYDADFYPYGVERPPYTNTCPQNYKFTSKERDSESSLDNFGARYDSSQYGRFMIPDPLLNSGRPDNPQTWNRYAYALNNPLIVVDPTGLYNLINNCATDDTGCNKQFNQEAQNLKNAITALANAVNNLQDGDQKTALQGALNAFGTENDLNNVDVQFGKNADGAAASTVLYVNGTAPGVGFTVTFDPSQNKGMINQAIDAAHEGTHIADESDPRFADSATTLSPFSMEYRGYRTSAYAAAALGRSSLSVGKNGQHPIWNGSWGAVDRNLTNYITSMRGKNKQPDHPETTPHDPWSK